MKKAEVDEDFLQWWERSLEEKGYNVNKKQLKVLAHPAKNLYHVYSYHEFFNAMRKGEYIPLMAYRLAYHICSRSRLEELAEGAEIISFPRRNR